MGNEITLLMIGLTQLGKTTKVGALSACPLEVAKLSVARKDRTPITIDWRLTSKEDSINDAGMQLEKIELSYKIIEELLSDDNDNTAKIRKQREEFLGYFKAYFKYDFPINDIVGKNFLQELDRIESEILNNVKEYNAEDIKKLLSEDATADYIMRATISLPACSRLIEFLRESNLDALVMRDTRGILDTSCERLKNQEHMNARELGLVGADGVLLLSCSVAMPNQVGGWYGSIYSSCFESVPVFVETRHDHLLQSYPMATNWISNLGISEYLNDVVRGKIPALGNLLLTHFLRAFELLEDFGAMKQDANCWRFCYSNLELYDSLFVTPLIEQLSVARKPEDIDTEADDYQFFRSVCVSNVCRMVAIVLQRRELMNRFDEISGLKSHFLSYVKNRTKSESGHVEFMLPLPRKTNDREQNIKNRVAVELSIRNPNHQLLGERDGISGRITGDQDKDDVSRPRYLATVTSGVTAYANLHKWITEYKFEKRLTNDSGKLIAPELSKESEIMLVHVYLYSKLFAAIDQRTHFEERALIDRWKVIRRINDVRNSEELSKSSSNLAWIVNRLAEDIFG